MTKWWTRITPFMIAVVVTIALAAAATVRFNLLYLSLTLLRAADFLTIVIWLVSAFGFGAALLWRSASGMQRPLRVVTSIALGLGIESLATLALGLLGILTLRISWAIVIAGCLLAIWRRGLLSPSPGPPGEGGGEGDFDRRTATAIRNHPHPKPLPKYRERGPEQFIRWLWLLPVAMLTVACLCALLPPGILWGGEPNGYDVVEYHLQIPREWYELGRIVPLTHNVFSYFPFNVEMHYLLAMSLRHGPWAGMYTAQLMHVGFVAMAVAAIYALIAERSRSAATVAAVAMALTPWCGLLASVAYDEGGMLLWGTLAIGLLMRGNIVLAGLMAGLACGTKWTAVPIVLVAAPLAMLAMRVVPWKSVWIFGIVGLLTVSPWLIRNIAWTGDPVFPEMTSVFGKAHWSDTQVKRWHDAHEPRREQQNLVARAAALSDQVVLDWRYGFLLLPAAIVAAALMWRDRRSMALVLTVVALAVFWLFFTHLQSRFFVFVVPLAALLIGQAAVSRPTQAGIVVSLIGLVGIGSMFWTLYAIEQPIFRTTGMQNLDGFSTLGDDKPEADAAVVLVGDAHVFWYSTPTQHLFYRTVFDVDAQPNQSVMAAWVAGAPAEHAVHIIDPGELGRFSRTYWGIPAPPMDVLRMPNPVVLWGDVKRQ